MKSLIKLFTLLFAFAIVSCEQESQPIVEEDLNEFDQQAPQTLTAEQVAELQKQEIEVFKKYDGQDKVVIGNINSRSTTESIDFDMHSWYKSIQMETTSGWITVYAGYATSVTVVMPYHFSPDFCGTLSSGYDAVNWRVYSLNPGGTCAGFAADYKYGSTIINSDVWNHDRYTWNYFRSFNGDYGKSNSNSYALHHHGCGGSMNYCP